MKLTREYLTKKLINLSGFVVVLAAGGLGLLDFFTNNYSNRWLVLALVTILFLLNAIIHFTSWWWGSIRRQRLLMAAITVLTVALLAVPPHLSLFVILFFVLSVTAAMLFEPREWVLWIAAFAFISASFFITKHGWSDGLFSAIIYASAYYFFASFAKSTADAQRAEQESKRLLQELQTAHQQLQAYADQVQELTIVEERSRLAREMHDTVGHRLTVSAVQLEAAQRLISKDPGRAEQMVGTVREQIGEALAELRQAVAALRAPVEEDLCLDVSLQRLAEQFRQGTGLTVELEMPVELPELPPQHRRALYRAAQESLTNVQRHAQAKNVWMQLQRQDGGVALSVSDDGVGVPLKPGPGGFGLKGLQERAAQLGGDFHLAPRPGGGTRATFFVPLSSLNDDTRV